MVVKGQPAATLIAVMNAIVLGDDKQLNFTTNVPKPHCGENQVLIRMHACGLNRHDLVTARLDAPPHRILGLEVGGIVVESRSSHVHVGDRVAALVSHGAFAEFVVANAAHCIKLAHDLSFLDAAAIIESFATAKLALELADVDIHDSDSPAKRVLVHAGGSALGLALIQLLATAPAKHIEICRKVGASVAINRNNAWDSILLNEGGGKVDAIIDCVGASYYNANASVLALDGTIVFLGMLGGTTVPNVDLRQHLMLRHQLKFSTLSTRSDKFKAALIERMWRHCEPLFLQGRVEVFVHAALPLNRASDAFKMCAANENVGKIVMLGNELEQ
jgi:tumor protein p53-inducible protein 3